MYKIVVYIPEEHCEAVKRALFSAGAGRIGNYDSCSWQVLGEGQFQPLVGSQPFVGTLNNLEKVREFRVEMVCAAACLDRAIAALKNAHPYEEPAYDVWQLHAV